jgi:hypothetical protein
MDNPRYALYFQNSKRKYKLITELDGYIPSATDAVIADDQMFKGIAEQIAKFCNAHDYKTPYMRVFKNEDVVTFDVGSHTEFFVIKQLERKN